MQKSFFFVASFFILVSSCVTPKIHNALIAESEATKSALDNQQKKALNLQTALEELAGEVGTLKNTITYLRNDSIRNGAALVTLQNKYDELSEYYDLLASKNSIYIADKAKEIKQLLDELAETQ